MGCDGGTIPKRDELVRTKKKPEQKDRLSELSFRWQHCAITQQPLQRPIVGCQLGRLYNKEAVIEGILDKTQMSEVAQHIKNLKDVKDLNLTDNPAFTNKDRKGDSQSDNLPAPYICPMIGLEMNGKFRFIYLWSCGCVMSERAIKAVKTQVCHKCQKAYTEEDIVVLNGTEEDTDLLKVKMSSRQARLKAEKKSKKKSEKKETETSETTAIAKEQSGSKIDTASGSGVVMKRTFDPICLSEDTKTKKMRAEYSVAKDPNASSVYKSLFTSHKTAEEQTKAHWITYNPFYN